MQNNSRLFFLICCVFYIAISQAAYAQQSYSKVIAFGDSLSDTGNLSNITIPFPYPFYNNRISDGPVALDYFSEALGSNAAASLHLGGTPSGFNYAVAGGNIVGADVEDLAPQVSAHLNRVTGVTDPDALYVVIMGGNDVRAIRSITSSSVASTEIVLIVDQLITQLSQLIEAGAKHFFIANVANIGRLPETLQRETSDPGVSERVKGYAQTYNSLLSSRLDLLSRQNGAQITVFDLFTELEQVIENANQLGFTQTQVGCFVDFDFHPDCLFGLRFDRFVFFDNLHPTNATNQLIAQAMLARLEEAVTQASSLVPIGAIMLLLDE